MDTMRQDRPQRSVGPLTRKLHPRPAPAAHTPASRYVIGMRGTTHRWLLPSESADSTARPAPAFTGFDPLVARFLHARGQRDQFAADVFARPKLTDLHAPSLLPGVDRAAERLLAALRAGEPIVIYGDYDADGITAAAILYHMLRALAGSSSTAGIISTYVPHRVDEGYGLNEQAIASLAAEGAKVIVSVDCGITAHGPARAARAAGIDLLITDHHNLSPEGLPLPDACAIVHPRLSGTGMPYPFGDLCGAGVAFKLAWRLATMHVGSDRLPEPLRALLLDLLALAAVGTVADVVPLVGENRVIARFGLRRVKSTALTGLGALVRASGLAGEEITSEHAGFALAPRLNACGRLEHARDAVELLTTAGPDRAAAIAHELTKLNEQRRRTEKEIFDHACRLAEERGMTRDDCRAIVLAHPEWHPGVVGIACARLVARYHRPAILLNESNGRCRGSGRSIDGFNLHDAIAACAGHLEKFGGHDMAAGLALPADRLAAFTDAFTSFANAALSTDHLTPHLRIDCAARPGELTADAVRALLDLGPFGRGNPPPTILLRNIALARDPQPFGAGGDHASFFIRHEGREMRLIAWRWGERRTRFRAGQTLAAVVEPKLNMWQGFIRVEPELRDVCAMPE